MYNTESTMLCISYNASH